MAKRRFTKGNDLVAHQMKRLRTMRATIDQSVKLMQGLSLGDARELTSGTLSPRQTRGAYARGVAPSASTPTGRKRGRAPMLPINRQSSRLRNSIKSRAKGGSKAPGGGKSGFEVYARTPYAKFILAEAGTRKMVARGMKKEAGRRQKARQAAHVQHFVRKQRSI